MKKSKAVQGEIGHHRLDILKGQEGPATVTEVVEDPDSPVTATNTG